MRILMIEDDKDLCSVVCFHLEKEGYTVDVCHDGKLGLYFAKHQGHDLILLDRLLPDLNGIDVLRELRALGLTTPILMVTALDGIGDRVLGLDLGADDYLVKPFATPELLARIRALTRRPSQLMTSPLLTLHDVTLDPTKKCLTGPSCTCSLSKREYALLKIFLQNPSQVLTRDLLLNHVWGIDAPVEDGNLDNYILFIRKRLKAVGSTLQIKTLRGIGFKLHFDI